MVEEKDIPESELDYYRGDGWIFVREAPDHKVHVQRTTPCFPLDQVSSGRERVYFEPQLEDRIHRGTILLPTDAKARKAIPICTGVFDYFPRALRAVAEVSKLGNDQHNPGQPLHWDKSKSTDHADCIGRHLLERGMTDVDGARHSAKLAWRALALLEMELEKEEQ